MKNKKLTSLALDSILYALATGFNRGSFLLIFPILLMFLSIDEYAIFTLMFSVSQMIVPFLTISGTAGILREGSKNFSIGTYLLEKFIYIVFLNFLLLTISYYIFSDFLETWVFYSILFALLNAIYDLFLSFYRLIDNKKLYFIITFIKVNIIFLAVIYAKNMNYTLIETFHILFFLQSIMIIVMILQQLKKYILTYSKTSIALFKVLKYTIFIIPHGLALWIMNSSDKLLIKYYLGLSQLGIYSIAYTIASFQMILNSGISITLPQNIYKNYDYWLNKNIRIKTLIFFTSVTATLAILIIMGLKIDQMYFGLIKEYQVIINILKYVLPGLFLAGIYQFYAIFIFYKRKTKSIFYIGILTSIFNVSLNIYLLPKYGIIAAAITTLLTYIFYLISIIFYLLKLEKRLKQNIVQEVLLISISVTMLYYFLSIVNFE